MQMFYSLVIIQAQWNTTLQKHMNISFLTSQYYVNLPKCLFKEQLIEFFGSVWAVTRHPPTYTLYHIG